MDENRVPCAHCGRAISLVAKRCWYCGAIRGRQCPRCKVILPAGAQVCFFCKVEISESEPNYVLPGMLAFVPARGRLPAAEGPPKV